MLRREWPSLTLAQQGPLLDRFEQTPTLVNAYLLRTTLTALFECASDRATAPTRLQRWGEQVHTSGFVEGLKNKLKLLKRRCFGLDDPVELFRRLWLDIEGPRL